MMHPWFARVVAFCEKHTLIRGIAVYSITWPASSLCQQAISGKEEFDFREAFRFCIFGTCYVAPTVHAWLKLSSVMFPTGNLKAAVSRALVEQVTYGPFAITSFFYGMSLLEGKTSDEAINEVKAKFLPTWKIGACVWPVIQTINHLYIPEKNKVPYIGVCGLVWTVFLAYMKELHANADKQKYDK